MSYNELFEYEDIVEKALKSDKLASYSEKYNISKNNVMMYLAFSSCVASLNLQNNNKKMIRGEQPVNVSCNNMAVGISEHIFDKVDFITNSLETYNSQFSVFDRLSGNNPNPYIITQEQFQNYLQDSAEEPQEDIEEYLKVMSLSNKASKIVGVFKEYNIMQTLDIANSINKKNYRSGSDKRFSTYKKHYIETYTKLQDLSNEPQKNGVPLKIDYMNLYLRYIRKEISEDELKSNPAYKSMIKLFKNNNPHNCYINPDSIYKHLSFEHTISTLYLTKNLHFKKALKEFSELSKTKNAYKYRVIKHQDDSIGQSPSGKCYNTSINFVVRGYNTPFNIHHDPNVISDLENKYGISIEEGDISPAFLPILQYKNTPSQRNGIGYIHTRKIRKVHPKSKEAKISDFSNNMQFFVRGLELSKEESIETEEVQNTEVKSHKKDMPNNQNVEDDSDAPSI